MEGSLALELDVAAKLNLTLEILGRRPDGWHEIRSVMQSIDLADTLSVRIGAGDSIDVATTDPRLPTGEDNLAGRAARLLLDAIGRRAAVTVHIEKRIPVGGGLGGGSADAAGVLWGLNRLLGRPCGAGTLLRLAARIGADVPFFLVGGTCVASGRGERLRRLPPLGDCRFIVACPDVVVETQWAYTHRAKIGLTPRQGYTTMLESAIRQRRTSLIARALWNDFEELVVEHFASIRKAKERLLGAGVEVVRLSGSGAVVFGFLEAQGEATGVIRALRGADHPIHVARPVDPAIVPRALRGQSRHRPG
jgi:4-diphosphocytidyl-2-C-methyl-D-erythritol kinase